MTNYLRIMYHNDKWKPAMQDSFQANGQTRSVDVEPNTPMLWILREHLGTTLLERINESHVFASGATT